MVQSDLFIGGAWVEAEDRMPVFDPSNGEVIAEVSHATEQDCDAAAEATVSSAQAVAALSPRERGEILRRAYVLMVAEAERIAQLLSRENGKVLADARAEVSYAAEFLRWFSEEAVRVRGDYRLAPSADKRIIMSHSPIGPSLLITPWNFPAAMTTRKVAPAFAAGCPVLIKPASETPLTTLAIVDILQRAGFPDGSVNVIVSSKSGPTVSRILADDRIRALSFTGSTPVGKLLLKQAADNVLRTSMELGGNAPFIVLEDADIDEAVAGAMIAKLRNGGAACTAANRFIVHESVSGEFAQKLTAAMQGVRVGPGLHADSQLGASVSLKERDKIAELVTKSLDEGAALRTGGIVPMDSGAFYSPTVIEVDRSNGILREEIFGPVAPIVSVVSDEDAISLANDSQYGLISYVFSRDITRAMDAAERMESGMVALNRGVISDPAASFGGVKQSGLGREGGFDGIHEFLESKYIGI